MISMPSGTGLSVIDRSHNPSVHKLISKHYRREWSELMSSILQSTGAHLIQLQCSTPRWSTNLANSNHDTDANTHAAPPKSNSPSLKPHQLNFESLFSNSPSKLLPRLLLSPDKSALLPSEVDTSSLAGLLVPSAESRVCCPDKQSPQLLCEQFQHSNVYSTGTWQMCCVAIVSHGSKGTREAVIVLRILLPSGGDKGCLTHVHVRVHSPDSSTGLHSSVSLRQIRSGEGVLMPGCGSKSILCAGGVGRGRSILFRGSEFLPMASIAILVGHLQKFSICGLLR